MALCLTCHNPLTKTASGYVCAAGHTKILSEEQAKALERSQLPRVTRFTVFDQSYYTIEGQQGIWHKSTKAGGELRASTGYMAYWFMRCPELERRIVDALGDQLAEAALCKQ